MDYNNFFEIQAEYKNRLGESCKYKLLKNIDICTLPDDHNPGVSNAFMYGGFLCGILSLICELAKGFIPVYLGQKYLDINSLLFVPVLVAPVFGHAFPFLQKEKGGKALSVGRI